MNELRLPEGSLLLHIGPKKTGSTAIQQALHAARATLAEHGVHYGGPKYRMPAEAGWAVLGIGSAAGRPPPRMATWRAVLDDVRDHPMPRACLSNEDLAMADAAAIERIVGDLGRDRLHVVYVARRLDKLLPSTWQQRLKARMTLSYPDFLALVAGPDDGSFDWRMTWRTQEVGTVLDRWAEALDPGRITVIVSDEDDHDLIPRTFGSLLGLPDGTLVAPTDQANRSLTYPEAEALRRVNQVFVRRGWDSATYWRIVQGGLVDTLRSSPRPTGAAPVPGLPVAALEAVHERADRQIEDVERLRAAGVRVVGDPDLLRTRERVAPDPRSADPVEEVSLDLLGTVVAGTVSGALDLQRRTLRQARRRDAVPPPPARRSVRRVVGAVRRRLTRGGPG